MLRGKHKPAFTPHVDCGDHVIIINCRQGRADRQEAGAEVLTAATLAGSVGLKETKYATLMAQRPEAGHGAGRQAACSRPTPSDAAAQTRLRVYAGS